MISCGKLREVAGSSGKLREVAGSCGKLREVAGSCGKLRKVAGSCGKLREVAGSCGKLGLPKLPKLIFKINIQMTTIQIEAIQNPGANRPSLSRE